ncbi:MAG: NUDIX hydrolase [Oligoflexia bacterium]|nr:NUDIX hydrolase [Oligoflexia bacterium]
MQNTKGGWKVLSEKTYESFKIFSLVRSTRRNPRTGADIDFVRIDGLDWANVIALTPDDKVVLIKQYRHGSDEFTLELPGGCVEVGENPSASVMRELEEETGYTASKLEPLGVIRPNPALLSNRCHLFIARDAKLRSSQKLDAGEDIEVLLKPLSEALDLVRSGSITHALMVAAFGLMSLKMSRAD